MAIQSRRRGKKSGRGGFTVLCMILLGIAGVVGGAVWYKQELVAFVFTIFSGPEKVQEAKRNVRGTIYDRSFKELALSLDRVSVYVRPRELGDVQGSAGQLATVLGLNEQDLLARLDKDSQRVWLAKNISLEEEKAVDDLRLPGVFLHREQARYYPYKGIAAHVVGFADHNMGLAGAEHYYNRLLDQASISQGDFPHVDLGGHHRTGISGQHLVLTIDLKIQDFLEKYVAAFGAVHEGAKIAAFLMEAETGAIIANANFPSFDPNLFYQYKRDVLANILLEPVVVPEEILGLFRDSVLLQANQDEQVYPWSIVAGSVDTGGASRLWERLGLSELPDLDFSVQDGSNSIVGPEKKTVMSGSEIGVRSKATPIQLLLALNSLLNGGKKKLPHVLDRILERNGEHEYFFKTSVTGNGQGSFDDAGSKAGAGVTGGGGNEQEQLLSPVSAETWRLFKALGHRGPLDSFFIDVNELYLQPVDKGNEYLRTRMMFALLPADKPELILMVMVRQPYLEPSHVSAKDGSDLVGPATKILPSMVALQQVHKNLSDMMNMSERKESNYQLEQEKKTMAGLETMLEQHPPFMPDLVGMSLRRALRLLQDRKIKVRIQGSGRVVAQSPAAGMPLTGVKECLLTLKKDEKTPAKGQSVNNGKIKSTGVLK